jgi:hypothetical protein
MADYPRLHVASQDGVPGCEVPPQVAVEKGHYRHLARLEAASCSEKIPKANWPSVGRQSNGRIVVGASDTITEQDAWGEPLAGFPGWSRVA